jgi:hypothetical protein
MYYERTGDGQAREDAFRSLNYATYFADDEGHIACCGLDYADSYWFDDGYGDHIRNYLWAMGAIPEFAPIHQDHLLRSTSVVTEINYSPTSISYKTFDERSTEKLRLTFRPSRIIAGNTTLKEGAQTEDAYSVQSLSDDDHLVLVKHTAGKSVAIYK